MDELDKKCDAALDRVEQEVLRYIARARADGIDRDAVLAALLEFTCRLHGYVYGLSGKEIGEMARLAAPSKATLKEHFNGGWHGIIRWLRDDEPLEDVISTTKEPT